MKENPQALLQSCTLYFPRRYDGAQHESQVTYIDVFQIQEVQGQPVALPDDGWPQVSSDSTCQHCAQPHGHCGHADPLLRGEAELNHLCREKEKAVRCRTRGQSLHLGNSPGDFLQGGSPGGSRTTENCPPRADGRHLQTDTPPGTGAMTCQMLKGLCGSKQIRNHSECRGTIWAVDL